MALTVQDVIDGGFSKSISAVAETIAEPAEMVARVGFCLREVFDVIARENPYMIGARAQLDYDAGIGGWQRPVNCLRAIGARADATTIAAPALASGARIVIVPFDDQKLGKGKARLTEFGQAFIPTGQAMDPSGGTLTLLFARNPVVPTATNSPIDALFPEAQADLLNYDMAAFLAEKDERDDDAGKFNAMKSALLALLISWTHGQTYELVQRFPIVTPPLTNTRGGRQADGE